VHSPIMVMEEGAKFQGVSDMGATAWPEEVQKLPGNVRDINPNRGRPIALLGKEQSF